MFLLFFQIICPVLIIFQYHCCISWVGRSVNECLSQHWHADCYVEEVAVDYSTLELVFAATHCSDDLVKDVKAYTDQQWESPLTYKRHVT